MKKIDILTLFPDMFTGVFGDSILKKAADKEAVAYRVINFREFSTRNVKQVDDYPFGGGAGMVLQPQPIFDAVENIVKEAGEKPHVILLCPQGQKFTQSKAEQLSQINHLVFICGHYEGVDERVRQYLVDEEISIGDYILTGGELASMVIVDSVIRLIPGVLGNEASAAKDSYSSGLLEYPHYTRPMDFRGYQVPEVLLSGHHKNIEEWRHKQSIQRTFLRRPDLLENIVLSPNQLKWIDELVDCDEE